MIYKSVQGDLDLSKITRLYPAVVVDMQGEVAEMSLEWLDTNSEVIENAKVKIVHYVLVFDFAPLNEDVRDRTTLIFENREDLIEEIQVVAKFFD